MKFVISTLNPLAPGVEKKVIHTLSNLTLKVVGYFKCV